MQHIFLIIWWHCCCCCCFFDFPSYLHSSINHGMGCLWYDEHSVNVPNPASEGVSGASCSGVDDDYYYDIGTVGRQVGNKIDIMATLYVSLPLPLYNDDEIDTGKVHVLDTFIIRFWNSEDFSHFSLSLWWL